MKKMFPALILTLVLAGCGHYLVGDSLYSDYCYPLQGDLQHHYIELTHAIVDYDFTIDEETRKITFDGDVTFRSDAISGGQRIIEFKVTFLFCNKNRKVISAKTFAIYSSQVYDKVAFQKSYTFKPEYEWVAVTYSGIID